MNFFIKTTQKLFISTKLSQFNNFKILNASINFSKSNKFNPKPKLFSNNNLENFQFSQSNNSYQKFIKM